jgi:16S rRNA (cytidine1402-2'-O)-methyltransferase
LSELRETLGNRRLTICRELTKKYEEAYQTTFDEALARYGTEEPKGECVLVIEGKSREQKKEELVRSWEEMEIEEHMDYYENQGIDRKEAMRMVAKDRGISKRDVYQYLVERNR